MSRLNGIAEMLDLMDCHLAAEDWDGLAAVAAPTPPVDQATPEDLAAALAGVEAMQAKVAARMAATMAELESSSAFHAAARTYLATG